MKEKLWFVVFSITTLLLAGCAMCPTRPATQDGLAMVKLPGGLVGIEMVQVPAGTFYRVDQKTETRHPVTLTKPFRIGKYEVTQAQFEALMGYNPSSEQPCRALNVPVNQVTWDEAKNFCRKLTLLHKDALPAGYQFDLPTVAQWEYACCAGREMAREALDYQEKPFVAGWGHFDSPEIPQPVGLKQPNRWGLHDMHGNVSEWCRDLYQEDLRAYDGEFLTGNRGNGRVACGWNIFTDNFSFDALTRFESDAQTRAFYLGFRVALVPVRDAETVSFEHVPNDLYDYKPEAGGGR